MIVTPEDETKKRLEIIEGISNYVQESSLSGLLVTGSIAWGKNYAVTQTSDIDLYLVAQNINDFNLALDEIPNLPKETILTFKEMLRHKNNSTNTISMKTSIGDFNGSIYLFLEKDILGLVNKIGGLSSKYFTNLRPHNKQQIKEYKSLNGKKIEFTTPLELVNSKFYMRKDPIFIFEDNEFYGSIFISHLLFGDIYVDKSQILRKAQKQTQKYLKSLLPLEKENAYLLFRNYLPRIERMNETIVKDLFKSIWES